ncbi:MAG: sialidase family protein [Thiolinea sp.]
MKKVVLLLILSLSLFLVACQESSSEKQPIEKVQLLLNKIGFSVTPATLAIDDKLVLLLGEKRGVVFYEVGKEQILSADVTSKQWLHYDGKTLYAIWWTADEQKQKFLKIRTSNDAGVSFNPVVTINTGTGVLADISIATNGQGAVAIAYTDERKPGYGVYLNYSTDSGKTWASQDSRLDQPVITEAMKASGNTDPSTFANSPKLTYLGDKLVAIWQQLDMTEMGQSLLRIVAKSSDDKGKTWGAEANVFAAPNMQPVEMNTFANQQGLYVFAMLTDDETNKKGFTGFYSAVTNLSQWQEINNAALGTDFNKPTISWVQGVFSGDNLVLSFTVKPNDNAKGYAASATLSTKTNQWLGAARQLDRDKDHELTRSTFPSITTTSDNEVVIVWEDYRSLVPAIYMDISKDQGKTWLSATKPLTTPGLIVAKDPRLYAGKDKLWMTYFMVQLDGKNPNGTRVYQEFIKEDGQTQFPTIEVKMPNPDKAKERLIERANKFWVLREERKWEETWNYMEPVYRERFDKAQWLAQQGKISFSKTVVDETTIEIKGNLAGLLANVEVSINQQVAKEGLLESSPPNQQKVQMKWGWFYDDWYFMPDIIFGNHLEY